MAQVNIDQELNSTRFDKIKVRKNPGIYLSEGDTITNSAQGVIDFSGADILAGRFIGGAAFYQANTYYVSPSFTDNTAARTYSTISAALAVIGAEETATILVYEGTYSEAITAKSNVSIIGVDNKKVIITSPELKTVDVDNKVNFELKNLTIENTDTETGSYCLYVTGGPDTDVPNLNFIDLILRKTFAADNSSNAVYCYATSFLMQGCYLYILGNGPGGNNVSLVLLDEYANPIFDRCKFKIANSVSGDSTIYTDDDSNTDFTIGNCQNYSNGYFINCASSSGATVNGRSFFNISNVGDYNFGNLIDDSNNIVDSDFIIR